MTTSTTTATPPSTVRLTTSSDQRSTQPTTSFTFTAPRITATVPAGAIHRHTARTIALPRRGYDHAWVGALALAAGLFAATPASTHAAEHPLDSWSPVTINSDAMKSPNDAIFVNGKFWAVGGLGKVQYSSNGADWTVVQSPASNHLTSIAYGNGRYVATGYYRTIMSSPDGIDWTVHLEDVSGDFGTYRQVIFANNQFLAIGSGGAVQISPDGITWTPAAMTLPSTSHYPNGVAWGNGLYVVALESYNSYAIMTSPDGIEWTKRSIGASSARFEAIAFGNGMFVATGWNQAVYSSPDGIEWTKRTVDFPYSGGRIWDVRFMNGTFVAFGQSGRLFTSPDGIEWTTRDSGTSSDISALVYNQDRVLMFRFAIGSPAPFLSDHWVPIDIGGGDPTDPNPTPASDARIVNLSTRAWVGTNDSKLISGFVIEGVNPKKILVRAVGPSLAQFGLQGFLADPTITLFNSGGQPVASNDDWGTIADQADLAATSAAVFAFQLQNGSKDAVLLTTVQPGLYSIHISGADGGTGIALAEVYDCEEGVPCKLVNVSSRGFVGTGDNVSIPGFVVSGTGPKKLLLRGIGPSLSIFGLTGTLTDPKITLVNGAQQVVAENDDWHASGNQAELAAASAQVFAFNLNAASKDAAMVVTVNPGLYTVIVSGVGGGTGLALVEAYEIP